MFAQVIKVSISFNNLLMVGNDNKVNLVIRHGFIRAYVLCGLSVL